MKTPNVLHRRRRVDQQPTVDDYSPEAGETDPDDSSSRQLREQLEWTGASAAFTKAVTVTLWVAVACGPTALAWSLLGSSPPIVQTASQVGPDPTADARASASALAENFVSTWLTAKEGDEQRLAAFGVSSPTTLPKQGWTVRDIATYGATSTSTNLWSVTVTATVSLGVNRTSHRRYFQVPISIEDDALAVQALPAPVAAPATASPVPLGYRYTATVNDSVAIAAQDFLTALLTGAGDVDRYLSPGAAITAITPRPYTGLVIDEVRTDQDPTELPATPQDAAETRLFITATAAQKNAETVVQYALTMVARDGRWEVARIDPAPLVVPGSPDDAAAPSPTTSTSTE